MKKYTIKVGEVFTQEKADELIEYLKQKDEDLSLCQLDDLIKLQSEVLQTELGDAYMHGLANGLLTAKATLSGESQPLFEKIGGGYIQVGIAESNIK